MKRGEIYPKDIVKSLCRQVHIGMLLALEAKGPNHNAKLKVMVGCGSCQGSVTLKKLTEEGLIRIIPWNKRYDGRFVRYKLTEKGKHVAGLLWAIVDELRDE